MQLAVRQPVRRDIARCASTLAAPGPVASALLLGVACYRSASLEHGLILGALLAVCATAPATLYIARVLRRGGLIARSERLAPLAIACLSVVAAAVLVRALGAHRDLQTVLLTMLLVLGLTLAATRLDRVSVHMAAITGGCVVLQLLFGTVGVALLPIVVLVGWSRLELGEHSRPQVVTGALLGAIGASAAYSLAN